MKLVMQSNDPVAFSFAEAVLKAEGIGSYALDGNMSVLEGSIGILPRRLMVADEDEAQALDLLRAADLVP